MGMRCYTWSAAVKVTALLTLPAAVTSVFPRLFYAALLGERHCEEWCRLHERLYHALL